MQRLEVREEGLAAVLFLPKEGAAPFPLVITLGGFRGGVNEERARMLALSGKASLALAYFGCPGLPSALQQIPLEYCEKAIFWAKSHPAIDSDRIALWGVSRGAELALLLGVLFSRHFRAINATLPSSVVYGAIQEDAPAWTYRGQAVLPSAPFPSLAELSGLGQTRETAIALTPLFLRGMEDQVRFQASQIPIENIECPLLIASAGDDRMWPSEIFAKQLAQRLAMQNPPCFFRHLQYPFAGHAISSSNETEAMHPIAKVWLSYGGSVQANEEARQDLWRQTLQFFDETL